MLQGFPDVQKAPTDVIDVTLDWTPFLPSGTTGLASHSVSTDLGDVIAADTGASGLKQTLRLTLGSISTFTQVTARVTTAGGLDFSRSFNALVR